jgi:hypothetical protein
MSASRYLSIISLALAHGACSSPDCGPHGASPNGPTLMAPAASLTVTYGGLAAGENHDCPDPMAPAGIVSVTISNLHQTPMPGVFTVCIPRNDRMNGTLTFPDQIQLVDATGSDASCMYMIDSTQPASGTAIGAHVCGNGIDKAGFEMTFDVSFMLQRKCGAAIDSIAASLSGSVAVAAE